MPITISTIAKTFARTGCSMKNFDIIGASSRSLLNAARRSQLRRHFHALRHAPEIADHDPVVAVDAARRHLPGADGLTKLDITLLHNAVVADDKEIPATLILLQGDLGHEQP